MNILEKIVEKTKQRTDDLKKIYTPNEIKNKAEQINKENFAFKKALEKKDISFICEIKKASPSKGIIAEEFPYLDIAKEYEEANADAISVLTEPYYFQGSTKYLEEISKAVKIPILRKDFIIDEMQIYESKIIGADAILLICAILDLNTLKSFIETAEEIGLSVLTEAHNEEEIKKAMQAGAQIIGINNRDLKTFNVDIKRSIELRKYVPEGIIFVSESGISTAEQVKELKANKTDAVLIGETFMKSKNKTLELEILRGLRK